MSPYFIPRTRKPFTWGDELTGSRSLHRKLSPDMKGRYSLGNLNAGECRKVCTPEASLSEEEGSGKPARRDPCGGRVGNCPLYRDGKFPLLFEEA